MDKQYVGTYTTNFLIKILEKDLKYFNKIKDLDYDFIRLEQKVIIEALYGLYQDGYKGFKKSSEFILKATTGKYEKNLEIFTKGQVLDLLLALEPHIHKEEFHIYMKNFQEEYAAISNKPLNKISGKLVSITSEKISTNKQYVIDNTIADDNWPVPYTKGKFNLYVASTNSGKTTYTVSLAIKAAKQQKKVLVLLTEDTAEDFMAVMPQIDDEILEYIQILEIPHFSSDYFVEIVEFAAADNYDYIVWDYIESVAFESDKKDPHEAFKELGQLINNTVGKQGRGIYFFMTIQANNNFMSRLGDKVKRINQPKSKKDNSPLYTEEEMLMEFCVEISHSYSRLIDSGIVMALRAKSIMFGFRFVDSYVNVVAKHKPIIREHSTDENKTGYVYNAILDFITREVVLTPYSVNNAVKKGFGTDKNKYTQENKEAANTLFE